MTYLELYQVISTPWLSTKDIMKIAKCGETNATKIRNEIIDITVKDGKALPRGNTKYVSTERVLNYLGLDKDYIFEMALKEQQIKQVGVTICQ